MAETTDKSRANEILDSALALLLRGGLEAVTTVALARKARCSKNTLYMHYSDRDAILQALVARQSAALNAAFDPVGAAGDTRATLIEAGTRLLMLLTSDESLALNRAALADPSGRLSKILIETGKERSAPKIAGVLEKMRGEGHLGFSDIGAVYRAFYGFVIADRQILALHRVPGSRLSETKARRIASDAIEALGKLFPA